MDIIPFKRPSAFLPVAMTLIALTVLLAHVGMYGITHEADEHPAAHVFQLLMIAQVPIVVFFVLKWVRRAPWQSLPVLGLQAFIWLVACAAAYWLT